MVYSVIYWDFVCLHLIRTRVNHLFFWDVFLELNPELFRCFCCFLHFGLPEQDMGHQSINTDASHFCSAGLPLVLSPHLHLRSSLLSPSLSLSLSRSLWWGDYGESDSWAQVSLPPGPAGCGTMTLLKFLQVFGFGDARQRGKAKARLSPECSSLRLSCPACGPVAAGLQQIKGWSLFSTEWCRCGCWLVGIPNLNLHLPRLRQSCSAFDWCVRSGS